ncbi:MAG TPA: tail fiber domain-containing protein [Fimbriimonadaceae bacterium]|nr:tail fiber domain-containing protein [Fimbriimonadaceae bacterium]
MKRLFGTIALGLAAITAHAQSAPMMVHYQGRLTQANGLPLTTPTATVTMRIFPTASGGTALWDSGPRPVILRNGGIFSVMLGDTSIGMPGLTQSVFQTGIVYLELSIHGQAQPVGPRQPIVSVPWSILSQQANTVIDGAITTPKLANNAVTSAKIQDNTVGSNDLALDRTSLAKVSEGRLYLDAPGNGLYGVAPYTAFGDPNQVSYLDVVGNSSNLRIRGHNPSLEINRVGYGNSWVWGQRSDVGGSNDDLKLLRYANGNYSGIPLQINLLSGFVSLYGASALDPLTIRTSPGAYEQGLAIRNNTQTQSFRFGYFNGGLDIAAFPATGVSPAMWIGPNSHVGIGTNVASTTLQLSEGGNVGGAGGELSFSAYAGSPMASIKGSLVFGSTDQVGSLDFYTRPGVGFPLTHRFRIQSDGNSYFTNKLGVGGGPSATYTLYSNGPAGGTTAWNSPSDRRLKKNLGPIESALPRLLSLHGHSYEYRQELLKGLPPGRRVGFVAQEVEAVFPNWVSQMTETYKGLSTSEFDALATEAIREQQNQIDALRKHQGALTRENERLRRQNAGFEARLRALESKAAR